MRAVQGQPKEVLGFLKAAVPCDGAGWRRVWHRELTIFIYSPLTTTNFFFLPCRTTLKMSLWKSCIYVTWENAALGNIFKDYQRASDWQFLGP